MTNSSEESSHAARLRNDFNQSFAEPVRERADVFDDFLRLRIHGNPFAFRLADLSSLQAGLGIVGTPSAVPEFLGLAGLRGALVPVYDLHALLGRAPVQKPHWLAISQDAHPIGLAFEEFEGHLRRPRGSGTVELEVRDAVTPHGLQTSSGLYLVINVASICEVVQQRVRQNEPAKE